MSEDKLLIAPDTKSAVARLQNVLNNAGIPPKSIEFFDETDLSFKVRFISRDGLVHSNMFEAAVLPEGELCWKNTESVITELEKDSTTF